MRDTHRTKAGKRITSVVLALLLLLSLGLAAYFASGSLKAERELEALKSEYESRLSEKDSEISGLTESLAEKEEYYESELAELNEGIEALEKRLNTKNLTGIDPDHPAYMDKYPDFYAPQTLRANYAPEKTCYLTFDDGPSVNTQSVLDVLAENDVQATFFVVTKKGYSEETLKAIADAGHTIGMHSASHDYKKIYASVDAFLDDMYQVFTEIKRVTGQTPTVFRFPGGSVNGYNHLVYQEILAEMLRRGFVPFDWNVSSGDATKTTVPKDDIVSTVLSTTTMSRPIILMHDGAAKTTTVEALPEIIAWLKEQGYSFEGLKPNSKPVLFQYIDNVDQGF